MTLEAGTTLGPYEILSPLGAGGMGEVYRATDTKLKRQVAVKVLPEAVAADSDRLARFQREAEVLASLNHPNIAAIHGLEESGGVKALVMELVEGPTLADRIAQGPIPIDEAIPIARQIAEALEAAHDQGIIHRDLKPANVKVREDGTVKVLDFGLAKALEPVSAATPNESFSPTLTSPALSQAGFLIGTAAYMSPEQARGKAVDTRADVWSFGVVFYEMLTGRRAFEGEDISVTLADVIRAEPAWDALPVGLSPAVALYLKRCLQKDPRERVQAIGDVRLALMGAFETVGSQAAASVADTPPVWRRALPIAAALVLVGGIAVWSVRQPPAPGSTQVTRFALLSPAGVAPRGAGVGRHVVVVSPQRSHIVYWADNQLHLRSMAQLEERVPVRGTEGAREPFLSPDGQWIGFWQQGQLRRVSISGGAVVALCDSANPWGVSWGEDGMILYGQGPGGIWRVPGTGGTPEQVIAVADGEVAHGPQLLPGGEWVLFTLLPAGVDPSWDAAQVVAQSLETGERSVLIQAGRDARYLSTGHLVYGLNGVLLAVPFDVSTRRVTGGPVALVEGVMDADVRTGAMHFSVSADGALVYLLGSSAEIGTLVWVDRDGRQEPLAADASSYQGARVSPDSTRVVVDIGGIDVPDVHVYDIERDALTRLTSAPTQGRYPLWTPDGQRVVFYSDFEGGGLFSKAADGTGAVERLTTTEFQQKPYSWSADGRVLVFEQGNDLTLQSDVYVLSIGGESAATPLLQTPASEMEPAVSPDGRWVAYTLRDAGSAPDVYVRPFPTVDDGRWQISNAGGFSPLWSPDGKALFFINRVGAAMVVPVELEPTFRPGTPAFMFDLPPFYRSNDARSRRQWDIAPDGERFLFLSPGDASATDGAATQPRIVVVLNWQEELKRLVPTD